LIAVVVWLAAVVRLLRLVGWLVAVVVWLLWLLGWLVAVVGWLLLDVVAVVFFFLLWHLLALLASPL